MGGCTTLSFDKERATEKRKLDLCTEIETRDLPQCAGGRVDSSHSSSEMAKLIEAAGLSMEVLKKQVADEVAFQRSKDSTEYTE